MSLGETRFHLLAGLISCYNGGLFYLEQTFSNIVKATMTSLEELRNLLNSVLNDDSDDSYKPDETSDSSESNSDNER